MTDALKSSNPPLDFDRNQLTHVDDVATVELNPHPILNGDAKIDHDDSVDSPSTPFSNDTHVKIDSQTQESDVRHEPVSIKVDDLEKVDSTSTVVEGQTPVDQVTPVDSSDSTVSPSADAQPADVQMAEPGGNNDMAKDEDIAMDAFQIRSPSNMDLDQQSVTTSRASPDVPPSSSSMITDTQNDCPNGTDPLTHPAKRARKHSDADEASMAHSPTPPPAAENVHPNGTSTPTASSAPPTTTTSPPQQSTLSNAQFRFTQGTLRTLKKLKDAAPFLRPVDPIALNIPHYTTVIKTPMDFSTVERKLASSNPTKPDLNLSNPRYFSADAFISDIRLIFHNCLTFNGPDHAVTLMGKRVEEVFDKQLKQMPPALEPKPLPKKVATPPPPPPPPATASTKKAPARRLSTSVPVIRRSETEAAIGRPKREIHPPPPKDLPYADAPKKPRRNKRFKDDGTSEQLKFCVKLLVDLHRKQHYNCANPFYEPVDWQKLELPSYPKVIKKPMDLSTMKKKLDNGEYSGAQKFYDDFKLMIRNCFQFNPAGTPVNQAGIELQRVFDEKWKNLPSLHTVIDDEEEEEDDSEEERTRAIAAMESQIETMRGSIAALKKPIKKDKKLKRDKVPVASGSKGKAAKGVSGGVSGKKKGKNKQVADDDVLTFEQKKDLSEAIQRLDGTKLEKVIQIIHEGVPEIRDSTEEIELEIDLLPATVLTKLYNFVLRPLRTPSSKRNRSGKGTGTGGLKRKSMDEDVEAEKIRRLEERIKMFEEGGTGLQGSMSRRRGSLSSRSSSSSEDSSDSD